MEPKAIKGGEVEMGHKELWDSLEEAENMWNLGLPGMRREKGVKGDICALGVPRMKGEPGESVSAPNMTVSPSHLTVNQSNTAFLLCSVSSNLVPQVAWSRVNGVLPSKIRRWRVISSQGKKRLRVLFYKVSQLATCFG